MDICELMPQQAQIADKFTILRGVQLAHLHTANEFYSGFPWQESPRAVGAGRSPAAGARLGRQQARGAASAIPPYVSLDNNADWERAYYLGAEHEPFRFGGNNAAPESLANMGRLQNRRCLAARQSRVAAALVRRRCDATSTPRRR